PQCGKPLTIGVDYRVDELADRPVGFVPPQAPRSQHIVPLAEIIGDAFGQKKGTKKVEQEYWKLIHAFGNEFSILLDLPLDQIGREAHELVTEGIKRVRAGKLVIRPGYDGIYGVVKVFEDDERNEHRQQTLFSKR
ncbi:MAG: DNA helicase UvrD, partial [Patescibacteria group bacterium]